MTISGLARAGDVGVETVRYYQRIGLLDVPDRTVTGGSAGGVRRYDERDAERLRFIRQAKNAGFSLDEIRDLLGFDRVADRTRVRALAEHRLSALDRRIEELDAARTWLRELERRCAGGEEGPCPIIEAFAAPRRE